MRRHKRKRTARGQSRHVSYRVSMTLPPGVDETQGLAYVYDAVRYWYLSLSTGVDESGGVVGPPHPMRGLEPTSIRVSRFTMHRYQYINRKKRASTEQRDDRLRADAPADWEDGSYESDLMHRWPEE
jgi:hypothetical protein